MINEIVTSLNLIVEDILKEKGIVNFTITNNLIEDEVTSNDLPLIYIYAGESAISKVDASRLRFDRNFYIELYYSRENRRTIEQVTVDNVIQNLAEYIIVKVYQSRQNLRNTKNVVSVSIPRDVGVGRAMLNKNSYAGTRIDLVISYNVLI